MTDLATVADREITELDASITYLAGLRAIKVSEKDQLGSGSFPHIELAIEIEAMERSIRRLQDQRARWMLANATRQIIAARRRA